jgi:hypothetical protein
LQNRCWSRLWPDVEAASATIGFHGQGVV